MITDQIINYIKDQITRGVAREKIRTNLISAGWEEADINQAFSFAEPNGEPAVLKIAPSFAVVDKVEKETSIDKISLTKDDQPYMPILKKDTDQKVDTNPVYNPIRPADEKITTLQSTADAYSHSKEKPVTENVTNEKPKESILVVRNNKPNDVISNFGDEGELKKPKTSSVLKNLVLFLFLILLIGNGFLWFYLFPKMDTEKQNVNNLNQNNNQAEQKIREVIPKDTNPPANPPDTSLNTSPIEALKNPTNTFKTYTTNYFTKNNSYGTTPMLLSSCNAPNTVFVDANVKKTLNQISAISKGLPYCSLGTDDTTKKNRMTSYLVYLPMDEAGYCIDSTGASLIVTKKPIGTSCVTAL